MNLIERIFKSVRDPESGDIGLFPQTPRDLVAVSVYCDFVSFSRVQAVYEAISPVDGRERVTHLNAFVKKYSFRYWNELFPFIVGPCWGILGKELTDDEAKLLPRIVSRFVYEPTLGMFILRKQDMNFLRIEPTKRAGIIPAFAPIEGGIKKNFIAARLKANGWKIETL
jgi:hypothetical protein